MSRFPVAFRLPAFASRSSDARRGVGPSSRSAYRTRPKDAPDLDGVTAFRTNELRPGWVPPIPQGRWCSPGRVASPTGPRRFPAAVPKPRHVIHHARLCFTRHQQGFTCVHRSGLPLACSRPDGTSRRLGFPPGFAPRRPGADDARQGGDRPSSTDLELHAQHHISRSSNRVAHSQRATSCRTAKGAHLGAVLGELRPVALLSSGWRSRRSLDSG